jgi:hypothetical protein
LPEELLRLAADGIGKVLFSDAVGFGSSGMSGKFSSLLTKDKSRPLSPS